jgi:hypothetical protein
MLSAALLVLVSAVFDSKHDTSRLFYPHHGRPGDSNSAVKCRRYGRRGSGVAGLDWHQGGEYVITNVAGIGRGL